MASRSAAMTDKVLKQKSKYSVCLSDKKKFLKQDHSKKLFICYWNQECKLLIKNVKQYQK